MIKITIKDRNGNNHEIDADTDYTLMEVLRDKGFDIEASCGGCCACATCHVYLSDNWLSKIKPIDDDEEAMLDQAFNVKKNSRLSCQIELSDELDGLNIEIAQE